MESEGGPAAHQPDPNSYAPSSSRRPRVRPSIQRATAPPRGARRPPDLGSDRRPAPPAHPFAGRGRGRQTRGRGGPNADRVARVWQPHPGSGTSPAGHESQFRQTGLVGNRGGDFQGRRRLGWHSPGVPRPAHPKTVLPIGPGEDSAGAVFRPPVGRFVVPLSLSARPALRTDPHRVAGAGVLPSTAVVCATVSLVMETGPKPVQSGVWLETPNG